MKFVCIFSLTLQAAVLLPAAAQISSKPALHADVFMQSEGVNTHINYTDGLYSRLDVVLRDLKFLGIDHVRDGLNAPGQFGSAPLSAYQALARAGVKFTFAIGGIDPARLVGTPTNPSLEQRIATVGEMQRTVPGSVIGVEGPNEINNQPIVYGSLGLSRHGQDELNAALKYQADLYRLVHTDPSLSGIPVIFFTGYQAGGIPVGPDPATTPRLADFNNQHPYPNRGEPPAFWVSRRQALGNQHERADGRLAAAVYTETGYATSETMAGSVSADVQAKYMLDLFLDTARAGIAKTYIYELLDGYAPGSRQGNEGWGLFDHQGQPKPVATAIRTMNAILRDPGPTHGFRTNPLAYQVTGESPTGSNMLLQKSDGRHVIALWDEQPIWDGRTRRPIAPEPHTITVTLEVGVAAALFDPLRSAEPVLSYRPTSTISVEVLDHPVFLIIHDGIQTK